MDIKNLNEVAPFTTKDGSEIRELLAYRNSVIRNQSLAEARLPVNASTQEHYHPKTEEIYYITHGKGRKIDQDDHEQDSDQNTESTIRHDYLSLLRERERSEVVFGNSELKPNSR